MRILVTGGAGFVGSQYVRSVLDGSYPGHEDTAVTVLDKLTYAGNTANLPLDHERLTFVRGDICDAGLLLDLLPGHDAVVHFAAESHVDRSLRDATPFTVTNVLGTHTLLECCLRLGIGRIVQISTDEVYGSIDTGSWTESQPLRPNSPYAASKAAADLLARSYHRSHGLPVVITRCSNNYGPYQHVEKLIPRFVATLLGGGRVPLYGDGHHVREWVHVADHCRGVQLALEKGREGEIYHFGGGVELSNRELTAQLLERCGAGWEAVRFVTDRKGHDRRYALDDGKARRELGYVPRVPFGDGLAGVVSWYEGHRSWWADAFTPYEEEIPPVPAPGQDGSVRS
ncbi:MULTISPECIES: dTDP-glucose 4,6-dehydratase [unclassified Streptomyces]|uniref:dTDP-glucose 4,6-dehydratase n=1 Tax=unclassified Streptomyces TaxID=2593676 RepID=UPI0019047B15|nr:MULTISPECIES: dTDP-glucose 4,6-dehydratase [unclassified Streptomyces]MCU4746992.1 dTDP-glucose 4,6-dehydratase [Streptomyces sp. G-5]QQN77675.1 dTDP-glucose 4,6-dehydratase [Streptomyces sp. XC 2026]